MNEEESNSFEYLLLSRPIELGLQGHGFQGRVRAGLKTEGCVESIHGELVDPNQGLTLGLPVV